jgi:hypothetical protein
MLYRPHWGFAVALLVFAVPLSFFGITSVGSTVWNGTRVDGVLGLCTVFGLCLVFLGFDLVYRHLIVDEEQLVRMTSLGVNRVCLRWENVQSWLVWPSDHSPGASAAWKMMFPGNEKARTKFENRGILLRLRDRPAPFFINDWEVAIPSAEDFLMELRRQVGDREIRLFGDIVSREPTTPGHSSDAVQSWSPAGIQISHPK